MHNQAKAGLQNTSIVHESIKRSVFGVFAAAYQDYKKLENKKEGSTEIW